MSKSPQLSNKSAPSKTLATTGSGEGRVKQVWDDLQCNSAVTHRNTSVPRKAGAVMATPAKALTALLQRTSIEDHEEVLKACNASLKISKGDLELQHVKFVALLKLDRYDDALRVLEEGGDRLKPRVPIERAYALYKIGEFEEAKDLARSVSEERGARHVEAQAVRFSFPKREGGLVLTSAVVLSVRGLRQCCGALQKSGW